MREFWKDLEINKERKILDICVVPSLTYRAQARSMWQCPENLRQNASKHSENQNTGWNRKKIEIISCTGAMDVGWKMKKKLRLLFEGHIRSQGGKRKEVKSIRTLLLIMMFLWGSEQSEISTYCMSFPKFSLITGNTMLVIKNTATCIKRKSSRINNSYRSISYNKNKSFTLHCWLKLQKTRFRVLNMLLLEVQPTSSSKPSSIYSQSVSNFIEFDCPGQSMEPAQVQYWTWCRGLYEFSICSLSLLEHDIDLNLTLKQTHIWNSSFSKSSRLVALPLICSHIFLSSSTGPENVHNFVTGKECGPA